jgi:hypothetical protein
LHRTVFTCAAVFALIAAPSLAPAQEVQLGELGSKNPRKLSKEELEQLLPGAAMSRVSQRGSTHRWTNEADGSLIVSTDNAGVGPHAASSTHGKWRVSDDGRLCVTIEWRMLPTEDWCRFVYETSDGYWSARSETPTDKAYRLNIRKRG